MVEKQIAARGIADTRVLKAMGEVPRERFVSGSMRQLAYDDSPLPIGEGQTISQPYMVAVMTEALKLGADDRVLEIGTGCGYAAAVLSRIAGEVYTVERHQGLANQARKTLDELGYHNVHFHCGDGTLGWPEKAPFDAIEVAAAGPEVPRSLLEQLKIGGRLVIPVGVDKGTQELLCIERSATGQYDRSSLGRVQFVPLIGIEGWSDDGRQPQRRDL